MPRKLRSARACSSRSCTLTKTRSSRWANSWTRRARISRSAAPPVNVTRKGPAFPSDSARMRRTSWRSASFSDAL